MNMSTSAYITWTIHKKSQQITWVEIIQFVLSKGWNLNVYGQMSYLPLDDNDMYNWQHEQINEEKLFKILSDKDGLKEPLGVSITWKDSNIGGELLTLSDIEIMFSIAINRKTIPLTEEEVITDVNWYLLNFNSIFSQIKDIVIISTNFSESI